MRNGREPNRRGRALRAAAVLLALFQIAALSCLTAHRHANPQDSAPCLVCAAGSAPAAQPDQTAAAPPQAASPGFLLCADDFPSASFLPGSAAVRAPPAG